MLAFSSLALVSSLMAPAVLAAEILVKVGADGKAFTPPTVNATAGDVITFEFHPLNHTLTQSTLANPCTPVPGGGSSGFMPVPAGTTTGFPTKKLTVPDATTPLWFFCEQVGHCAAGMVFSVNPGTLVKQQEFVQNALATSGSGTAAPPPPTGGTGTGSPIPAPGPGTGTSTPPPTTGGQTINIAVGMGGLTFTPNNATAQVGDQVVFTFMGGNHTVTQSTFADPCTPMPSGTDTGFTNFAQGLTSGFPTFTFPVTDTSKPLWFFCKQANHCEMGMVFSLNAPLTGNTAAAFQQKAMGLAGSTGGTGGTGGTGTNDNNSAGSLRSSGVAVALAAAFLAALL